MGFMMKFASKLPLKMTHSALLMLMSLQLSAQELKPEWELGAVGLALSQQAYPGSSYQRQAALIAPVFVYRGRFLRANENGVGLRAVDEPSFELDLGFAASLGARSDQIPKRAGMQNLGTLVEFGPRSKWYLSSKVGTEKTWLEMPVRGVFNLNNRAHYVGMTAEPQIAYEINRQPWRLWASAGALIGDSKMNQYLYGVSSQDVTANRAAYQGKAGIMTWKASLAGSYNITPNLSVFASARANTVAGTSNASSPLIDQKRGLSYGIGVLYFFAKSDQMVKP